MITKVVPISLFVQLTVVLAIQQIDRKPKSHPSPKNKPTFSRNFNHQVHATGHSKDWNKRVLLDKRNYCKNTSQYHKNDKKHFLISFSSDVYNSINGSFLKQVKSKYIDQWENILRIDVRDRKFTFLLLNPWQ